MFKIGLKVDGKKPDKKTIERKIIEIAGICDLAELLDMHPYDVSGGEQQRAALAKVLLCKPDVLLLDEPTKGMDNHFKKRLAEIIRRLCVGGGAVIAVSHDIEFCGAYADKCAMFFDGSITTSDEPRMFFSGNSFYTTAADKISHGIFAHTVTAQDVIDLCNTYESYECESGVERV